MAQIRIDYAGMDSAVSRMMAASERMKGYGEGLGREVVSPLQDLPGKRSEHQAGAVSMAEGKARDLSRRAEGYHALAAGVRAFSDHAKEADSRVRAILDGLSDKAGWRDRGLLDQWAHGLYNLYTRTVGASLLGGMLGGMANAFDSFSDKAARDFADWRRDSGTRYAANIAISAAELVAAVAVLSAAVTPVGWALAAVALVSASVAFSCTVASNSRAMRENKTDPGLARYHGRVNDVGGYLRQNTTSASMQAFGSGLDFAGDVAGLGLFAASGFKGASGAVGRLRDTSLERYTANLARDKFGLVRVEGSAATGWAFDGAGGAARFLGYKTDFSSASSAVRSAAGNVALVAKDMRSAAEHGRGEKGDADMLADVAGNHLSIIGHAQTVSKAALSLNAWVLALGSGTAARPAGGAKSGVGGFRGY